MSLIISDYVSLISTTILYISYFSIALIWGDDLSFSWRRSYLALFVWSLAVITLDRLKTTVSWYWVRLLLNVLIRQFKTSLLIKLCLFFFFCQITRKINFNLVLKLYFQICRRRWLITYQLIHLNVANCSSDIYLWFTSLAILWSTISTPYIF